MLNRPQARARRQDDLTNGGFLPLRTNILTCVQGVAKHHTPVGLHLGVFLHFYAVRPGRDGGAGKNPGTGTRCQRLGGRASENTLADR